MRKEREQPASGKSEEVQEGYLDYDGLKLMSYSLAGHAQHKDQQGEVLEKNFTAKIAYSIFLAWVRRRNQNADNARHDYFQNKNYNDAAMLLMRAMIYAARAGDRIRESHLKSLLTIWSKLFPDLDVNGIVGQMLTVELDPQDIKDEVMYKEEGIDVYFLSSLMLDNPNFVEASYLELLSSVLSITPSLKKTLDRQAGECHSTGTYQ